MVKDIWKRKPEKMLSTEARDWLAELQEEWNRLQEKAEKLEAVKAWLAKALREGRISLSAGYSLGLRLGVEE